MFSYIDDIVTDLNPYLYKYQIEQTCQLYPIIYNIIFN